MKKRRALIIMAKPPVLGFAKTRLANEIGDEKALEVYKGLLDYTFNVASQSEAEVVVFYTHENEFTSNFKLFLVDYQIDGDLGEKMEDAFTKVLKEFDQVLMIGADCPDLTTIHIQDAYQALDSHEVVIGPGEDGGYYLLGMNQLRSYLFRNKSWSTEHLLEESYNELITNGHRYLCLEMLNDIDTLEDLKKSSIYKKIEL